ncbi:enoyl-CoA hydratase-related protein [Streptosporangium sp. NBC_01755]|uniref:enoyl-CoA hydratase/isomerase family protein n=1 Tax=unclassified Streptosporangium TaxID=2632669 RepID=UPI002DD9A8C0|nr:MULTISPECIES: enoyl-CoA hydratase-related protein [unclassified Streptosporangium]WSA26750.1 enoyl-CoA hydratase-related protein [Streptosporangium sp. NBC_01810]WSD01825.1 enoyl-CoA hydratase-related protein [Streptosporangium sp. NBC_01755]
MTLPSHSDRGGAVEYAGFDVSVIDRVLVVRLDRPEVGNALSRRMREPMARIWARVNEDDELRAVVVTGAGDRHFCTGADVKEIAETGEVPSAAAAQEPIVWSPLASGVRKPVICAVNGIAAGGGLHFVVDADVVIAAEHAAFLDTHVSVGQVGAVENIGLTHRLPFGTAMRMTLQGSSFRLDAARAHALGLVEEVVPAADLESTALHVASCIAANSPRAVELSRALLWDSLGRRPHDAAEDAWRLAQRHWSHPDFLEGARAFAEKRPARWTVGS